MVLAPRFFSGFRFPSSLFWFLSCRIRCERQSGYPPKQSPPWAGWERFYQMVPTYACIPLFSRNELLDRADNHKWSDIYRHESIENDGTDRGDKEKRIRLRRMRKGFRSFIVCDLVGYTNVPIYWLTILLYEGVNSILAHGIKHPGCIMKSLFTGFSVFNHLFTGVHKYFYTTVLFRCFRLVVLWVAYTFHLLNW